MFERKISKEELKAEIEAVVNPQLFALRKEIDAFIKTLNAYTDMVEKRLNDIEEVIFPAPIKPAKKKRAKKK